MKMVYARHYADAEQPNVITAFLPSSLSLFFVVVVLFLPIQKVEGN